MSTQKHPLKLSLLVGQGCNSDWQVLYPEFRTNPAWPIAKTKALKMLPKKIELRNNCLQT